MACRRQQRGGIRRTGHAGIVGISFLDLSQIRPGLSTFGGHTEKSSSEPVAVVAGCAETREAALAANLQRQTSAPAGKKRGSLLSVVG